MAIWRSGRLILNLGLGRVRHLAGLRRRSKPIRFPDHRRTSRSTGKQRAFRQDRHRVADYRVSGQRPDVHDDGRGASHADANRTGGTEYGGYTKTPGYDFRLQQGQDSLQSGAAARGGLYSGAAMRDLMKFGQDYGSNEYGTTCPASGRGPILAWARRR